MASKMKTAFQFSPGAVQVERRTQTRPFRRSQIPKCRCLREPAILVDVSDKSFRFVGKGGVPSRGLSPN